MTLLGGVSFKKKKKGPHFGVDGSTPNLSAPQMSFIFVINSETPCITSQKIESTKLYFPVMAMNHNLTSLIPYIEGEES